MNHTDTFCEHLGDHLPVYKRNLLGPCRDLQEVIETRSKCEDVHGEPRPKNKDDFEE